MILLKLLPALGGALAALTFTFQYDSIKTSTFSYPSIFLLIFTFQYDSIKTQPLLYLPIIIRHLHFNMILLKLDNGIEYIEGDEFTFQYDSIKTRGAEGQVVHSEKFTFQYDSIKTYDICL